MQDNDYSLEHVSYDRGFNQGYTQCADQMVAKVERLIRTQPWKQISRDDDNVKTGYMLGLEHALREITTHK